MINPTCISTANKLPLFINGISKPDIRQNWENWWNWVNFTLQSLGKWGNVGKNKNLHIISYRAVLTDYTTKKKYIKTQMSLHTFFFLFAISEVLEEKQCVMEWHDSIGAFGECQQATLPFLKILKAFRASFLLLRSKHSSDPWNKSKTAEFLAFLYPGLPPHLSLRVSYVYTLILFFLHSLLFIIFPWLQVTITNSDKSRN